MICCRKWTKFTYCISIGVLLTIFGLITIFFVPQKLLERIKKSLPLYPIEESETFEKWSKIPIPIYNKFYFFNITNVEEILETGSGPSLQEVGPYVFREEREKVNITFNDDGSTVAYNQVRRWFFEPELSSNVSLDDEVYHLNVPLIASSDFVIRMDEEMKSFYYFSINRMQNLSKSVLFPKHKVRELMFDGYTDALIQEASKLHGMKVPFDHFGWFYKRNDTSSDGRHEVYTGHDDLSHLGKMFAWNGSETLMNFKDECNSLESVSTEFQSPFATESVSQFKIFVGDICRPLKLSLQIPQVETKGVLMNRYSLDPSTFDYSIPENTCFCLESGCPKNGVADTSKCTYDSPTEISQPHFLNADPSYFRDIQGLDPDEEKHSFFMDLHPLLGIAGKINVGIQINVRIRKDSEIDFLKNMTRDDFLFPVIWFSASAEITDDMAFQLSLMDKLTFYIKLSGIIFATIGLTILILTLVSFWSDFACNCFNCCKKNRRENPIVMKQRQPFLNR